MKLLDRKLENRVKTASLKLGLPEHEVINRAVSMYLGSVEDMVDFNQELRMWDVLSAKTMRKYKF